MSRGAGRGALIGLAVGVALALLLILLPAWVQDSFYEITDSLVVMGIPILVASPAIGALVGARTGRR